MPSKAATRIDHIFTRLALAMPEPRCELDFVNPYTLLVAVVLSAQATDKGVNKATGPLFAKVQTPKAMVALGEERLKEYIRTIGLWRAKAANVVALSRLLIARHGGLGLVPVEVHAHAHHHHAGARERADICRPRRGRINPQQHRVRVDPLTQ